MKAIVILETMWNWRGMTTAAGYKQTAPRSFAINPRNFTGKRLHRWLNGIPFLVTNACPQLAGHANEHGKPDADWLRQNLAELAPFDLLLVCGAVAQSTYERASAGDARIIEMPHPAARHWTKQGIALVRDVITDQSDSGRIVKTGDLFSFVPLPS